MLITEPICIRCKHFTLETFTCTAFPDAIPAEIVDGDNNHTKPLPGQGNDIVFEPLERTVIK